MDAQSKRLVPFDANVLMGSALQEVDLSAPVIATPAEVVKKFFRR